MGNPIKLNAEESQIPPEANDHVAGWICPECKDEFANPEELQRHFEQNHSVDNENGGSTEPRQRIGSASGRGRSRKTSSGDSGSNHSKSPDSPDVVPVEFPKQVQ